MGGRLIKPSSGSSNSRTPTGKVRIIDISRPESNFSSDTGNDSDESRSESVPEDPILESPGSFLIFSSSDEESTTATQEESNTGSSSQLLPGTQQTMNSSSSSILDSWKSSSGIATVNASTSSPSSAPSWVDEIFGEWLACDVQACVLVVLYLGMSLTLTLKGLTSQWFVSSHCLPKFWVRFRPWIVC